jgi:acetyl esterase/lipase
MDLWLPQGQGEPIPTIVYIHGGGWRGGTQYRPPFQPRFYDQGIGIAAITYRFSGEAPFPAMLYDCKTAVRWLRAQVNEYHLDPERFGCWGISAGGHLAALMGVTNHLPEWEGDGPFQEYSSSVQAVCSWCGPTDLVHTGTDPYPGVGMVELVSDVVGGPVRENLELARQASPVYHVRNGLPPFLLVNGALDEVVLPYHATSLYEKLCAVGVEAELMIVPNAGHSLDSPETVERVNRFFNCHLRK